MAAVIETACCSESISSAGDCEGCGEHVRPCADCDDEGTVEVEYPARSHALEPDVRSVRCPTCQDCDPDDGYREIEDDDVRGWGGAS